LLFDLDNLLLCASFLAGLTLSLRHFDLKINHPWPRPGQHVWELAGAIARNPFPSYIYIHIHIYIFINIYLVMHFFGQIKPWYLLDS
jgi:hypothetical protein